MTVPGLWPYHSHLQGQSYQISVPLVTSSSLHLSLAASLPPPNERVITFRTHDNRPNLNSSFNHICEDATIWGISMDLGTRNRSLLGHSLACHSETEPGAVNHTAWLFFLKRNFITPFITQQIVPELLLSCRRWEYNGKQTTRHMHYTTCAKTMNISRAWALRRGGSSRQLQQSSLDGDSHSKGKMTTSKRIQVEGKNTARGWVARKRQG